MAKCDDCGPGAGHMTKHCLVVAYDNSHWDPDGSLGRPQGQDRSGAQGVHAQDDDRGLVGQLVLRLGRGALVPPADGARPQPHAARPRRLGQAQALVDQCVNEYINTINITYFNLPGTERSERRDERPSGRVASVAANETRRDERPSGRVASVAANETRDETRGRVAEWPMCCEPTLVEL
eukprot:6967214-Prymnesium_polylepis.1